MNQRYTVTVSIPAFNEEQNIIELIKSVLNQETSSFNLEEVRIYTDGSTDGTVKMVKEFSQTHPKVKLIEGTTRKGKYFIVNQAFHDCKSDFLVILDADIALAGLNFLEKLVEVMIVDAK